MDVLRVGSQRIHFFAASATVRGESMNIAVIISTLNRPAVLHDTVLSSQRQCTRPRQVLVSSPSLDHVLPETLSLPQVQFVQSPIGSCAQRNSALGAVSSDTDL